MSSARSVMRMGGVMFSAGCCSTGGWVAGGLAGGWGWEI